MTKYLAISFLTAVLFVMTSCEEVARHIIFNDDTVCGENIKTAYQPLTNKAKSVIAPITANTRFVYVNGVGEEMILTLKRSADQKTILNYKQLCYNAEWNTAQYEYCEAQSLEYVFESDPAHNTQIYYNLYVNHVPRDGRFFDAFSASLYMHQPLTGGGTQFIADDRGQSLPPMPESHPEWERSVGDTTMLNRTFQNVIYANWGINEGKGIFFQKGVGIIAIRSGDAAFWVLDRVE